MADLSKLTDMELLAGYFAGEWKHKNELARRFDSSLRGTLYQAFRNIKVADDVLDTLWEILFWMHKHERAQPDLSRGSAEGFLFSLAGKLAYSRFFTN